MSDNIPEALAGACFHGEVWIRCPHCRNAIEIYGTRGEYEKDKFRYYKCEKCKKMFKDRITY